MDASAALVFLILAMGGVIVEGAAFPANTVAPVGGNATLRCGYQETSCSQIRWEKRSEFGGRLENISDGDTVYDATKYRLNASSSFCDLIIEDVQLTDAGTFVCTVNGSISGSAVLTVLPAAAYYRSDGTNNYYDDNIFDNIFNVQTTQAPRSYVVVIGSSVGGGVGGLVVLLVILYCICH